MLQRLVDGGNTVVVIEHNLDVIKTADWLIDLGPEGGDGGGRLVAEGTPEELASADGSYTGYFLRRVLGLAALSRLTASRAGGQRRIGQPARPATHAGLRKLAV